MKSNNRTAAVVAAIRQERGGWTVRARWLANMLAGTSYRVERHGKRVAILSDEALLSCDASPIEALSAACIESPAFVTEIRRAGWKSLADAIDAARSNSH